MSIFAAIATIARGFNGYREPRVGEYHLAMRGVPGRDVPLDGSAYLASTLDPGVAALLPPNEYAPSALPSTVFPGDGLTNARNFVADETSGTILALASGFTSSATYMRSTDGGVTWQTRTFPAVGTLRVAGGRAGKFIVVMNNAVRVSVDDGLTWTTATGDANFNSYVGNSVIRNVLADADGNFYLIANHSAGQIAVFKQTNITAAWNRVGLVTVPLAPQQSANLETFSNFNWNYFDGVATRDGMVLVCGEQSTNVSTLADAIVRINTNSMTVALEHAPRPAPTMRRLYYDRESDTVVQSSAGSSSGAYYTLLTASGVQTAAGYARQIVNGTTAQAFGRFMLYKGLVFVAPVNASAGVGHIGSILANNTTLSGINQFNLTTWSIGTVHDAVISGTTLLLLAGDRVFRIDLAPVTQYVRVPKTDAGLLGARATTGSQGATQMNELQAMLRIR